MKKVIAYGPEILALEDHFDGKTIILNNIHRFFISYNDTLYCNFTESENSWMAARLYEIEDSELTTFKSVFPESYSRREIQIDERNIDPLVETATTFVGDDSETHVPLTEPNKIAYTLFENLTISVSSKFASKFALSTHSDPDTSKTSLLTSYYRKLEEINLLECRKESLT